MSSIPCPSCRLLHFVAPGASAPDAASEASTPAGGGSVAGEPPAQHSSSAASVGGAGESTGGAGPAADPMHHDWALVETMLRQSIWHTDMLPASGEHGRDPEALALMMHVLECVQALRWVGFGDWNFSGPAGCSPCCEGRCCSALQQSGRRECTPASL